MNWLQVRCNTFRASAVFLLLVSCASVDADSNLDHALYICRQLTSVDAGKGEGEVWFGLQSERANASRKLWSNRGVSAIDARLAVEMVAGDRACLAQLKAEAQGRKIVNDWPEFPR